MVDDPNDMEGATQHAEADFAFDYEEGADVIDLSVVRNEEFDEHDIEGNLKRGLDGLNGKTKIRQKPFEYEKITHGKKSRAKEHNPFE